MTKIKVTLGPNAYSFHDQSTGITIARGEIKELTPAQLNKNRIKKAIASGHLRQVYEPISSETYTQEAIEKLDKRLNKLFDKGEEPGKAAKKFSLEELKRIAEFNDIKVEEGDTAADIIEVIFETYGSK